MVASGVDNMGTWETPEVTFKIETAIFTHLKNKFFLVQITVC